MPDKTMQQKHWVLWQFKKPWQWATVVRKNEYRLKWRWFWSVSATPNNKFMWPPRFHACIAIGPFMFQRHNAGIQFGFYRWELTFHW